MAAQGLRARNRARTHEEIVDAALTLFESQGYDETTCEEIAAAAGVAPRTFYRYFDGKADLLAVGRSDEGGPLAAITELLERPADEHPVDVIRHALDHPVTGLEAQRELVLRQFRVMMNTASLGEFRRESFHRFEDPFAAALATRLDLEADDLLPRWLASSAAAALRLSIERWVAGGAEPAALGPLVDDALELVRHGVDGGSSGRPTT